MAAALAEMKQEWHRFRDDPPGERFCNHRERMKRKSKKHAAVAMALGVLLLAGGVVLLFMPGPGLLLIVFGLALVGSHSGPIARAMDRAEPPIRERAHRLARWWRHLPGAQKVGVVGFGLLGAALALNAIWSWLVVEYVL